MKTRPFSYNHGKYKQHKRGQVLWDQGVIFNCGFKRKKIGGLFFLSSFVMEEGGTPSSPFTSSTISFVVMFLFLHVYDPATMASPPPISYVVFHTNTLRLPHIPNPITHHIISFIVLSSALTKIFNSSMTNYVVFYGKTSPTPSRTHPRTPCDKCAILFY
jgi:hypothetical protein